MSSLKETIYADLMESMRSKEQVKMDALRMLKAAIMKFEVAGESKKEAQDEDVLIIVKKEIKQRKEAVEQFEKGGRPELADKEKQEIVVLEKYMPEQMGEDEVREIAQAVIAEVSASSKADFGKVMGALMPKLKGQADGAVVSKVVGELLG